MCKKLTLFDDTVRCVMQEGHTTTNLAYKAETTLIIHHHWAQVFKVWIFKNLINRQCLCTRRYQISFYLCYMQWFYVAHYKYFKHSSLTESQIINISGVQYNTARQSHGNFIASMIDVAIAKEKSEVINVKLHLHIL